MANQNKILEIHNKNFSNLSINELDIKKQFNSFYREKEFDNYFKQDLIAQKIINVVFPYCDSAHTIKHSKDRFGNQCYLCKNDEYSKGTFTIKTNILLYHNKCRKSQCLTD